MNGGSTSPGGNWPRLAALSVIAVSIAVFLGWQAGEVTVSPDLPPPRTNWTLAARPVDDAAKDLAVLVERKPWTGAFAAASGAAAGNRASQSPKWRLAGIVERPTGNYALIAIGNPPQRTSYEYRAVGEKLPDGSTLIEIGHDTATTRAGSADGKMHVYRLFSGPEAISASPSGPAAASPKHRAELRPQASPFSMMAGALDMAVRDKWVL